jgi:Flp pilus assembly protein CpaB
MIDKAITTLILIIAAIVNLPMLFKFIWAAYQIKKEYHENKEEETDD